MRNNTLRLVLGAGLGVGLFADPFAPSRRCAAGRHPRRDPDGHPNGGGGTQPPEGGTPGDGGGTQPPEGGTPPAATGTPAADDWSQLFAGLTPAQVKAQLDQATESNPKAEKYDQLVASLNGDGTGGATPPTPEQLTTDLTAAQQGQRDAKVELALFRSAVRQNVDPERLLDSRRFMAGLDGLELDPAAGDFTSKVDDVVKSALTADKSLSTATPIGAYVGAEGGTPSEPPSIDAQIADAQSKGDFNKAMELKARKFAQAQQNSK